MSIMDEHSPTRSASSTAPWRCSCRAASGTACPAGTRCTISNADALYALRLMQTYVPAYRKADIDRALDRYIANSMDFWRTSKDSILAEHPHFILAAISAFGLLRQHRHQFVDDREWTDIFSIEVDDSDSRAPEQRTPAIALPSRKLMSAPTIARPSKDIISALKDIGTATVAGALSLMSDFAIHICRGHCRKQRQVNRRSGAYTAVSAAAPRFVQRGRVCDVETQLHRHVLYQVQEGDVVVVDARGDMTSGVFGDMMSTYFKGRGGAGIVIDGFMRDRPNVEKLDLALWPHGWTPELSCADGHLPHRRRRPDRLRRRDGCPRRHHHGGRRRRVVVVPVLDRDRNRGSRKHAEWEEFSRGKLKKAGASPQALLPTAPRRGGEYQDWRKANPLTRMSESGHREQA